MSMVVSAPSPSVERVAPTSLPPGWVKLDTEPLLDELIQSLVAMQERVEQLEQKICH